MTTYPVTRILDTDPCEPAVSIIRHNARGLATAAIAARQLYPGATELTWDAAVVPSGLIVCYDQEPGKRSIPVLFRFSSNGGVDVRLGGQDMPKPALRVLNASARTARVAYLELLEEAGGSQNGGAAHV